MESRLAAERKEAQARQQATEARLERERIESKRDFSSHSRWLKATFAAVVIGMVGIFVAVLVSIAATVNGYLPFAQLLGGG